MRLVRLVDRFIDPAPVERAAHGMEGMGADPACNLEMRGVVDMERLVDVVSGDNNPQDRQPLPGGEAVAMIDQVPDLFGHICARWLYRIDSQLATSQNVPPPRNPPNRHTSLLTTARSGAR